MACAVAGGNGHRAARVLKRHGVEIPPRSLYRWIREDYAEDYAEIRNALKGEIE